MWVGAIVHAKFCARSQVATCPASKHWDLPKPRVVTEEPSVTILCLCNLEPSSHKE